MKALTLDEFKALMVCAYEAGKSAQKKDDEIDRLLDEGTKQCPERPSFEDWFDVVILGNGMHVSYTGKPTKETEELLQKLVNKAYNEK